MTEVQLLYQIKKYMLQKDPKSYVKKFCERFESGFPDVIIVSKGKVLFVELKIYPKRPRRVQDYILDRIRTAGGSAFFITERSWKSELAKRLK